MDKLTFVVDIDDTISETPIDPQGNGLYKQAKPIINIIDKLQKLHAEGHKIILFTARGMRTFKGDIEKITNHHKDLLTEWLKNHNVPYDELVFGKPWGPNVYYVDDKNLTINQFLLHSYQDYPQLAKTNSWWRVIEENKV